MTNILIEAEEFFLSTTHEVYKKFLFISEHYPCSVRLTNQNRLNSKDFDWCDIIVSVRSFSEFDLNLAKIARAKGKLFYMYLDDDLLGLAPNYGRYGTGAWPKRQEAMIKLLNYTDLLITCNPLIGEKYSSLVSGLKYIIANAAIGNDEIHLRQWHNETNKKIKIVYYVSDGTIRHFEQIVRPILPFIAEKFGEKIALYLMTVHPDLHEFESKMEIHYIDHMSYDNFKQFMAEGHFDIGIAPLIAGGFSQYKYFNKFVEYSRYGIAGIYSSCIPYTFVIHNEVNGLLSDNSPSAWESQLSKLICDSTLRHTLVENAQKQLKEEFALEKTANKLVHECPQIISHSAPQSTSVYQIMILHILRRVFVLRECVYFSRIALRTGGLRLFGIRVIRYLRRIFKERQKERSMRR